MDQQQAQMMQNYPDPTAVATEANGPFYAPNPAGQQQQQPQQLQQQAQQEPQQQHQQQMQHQPQDPEQEQRHSNPELQIAQHAIQFSDAQPQLDLKGILGMHAQDPRMAEEQQHQQQQQQQQQPQQMTADMGHVQNQPQYGSVDGTTPRKRSKVSRACDECRRKKIRCDATTESGGEQCTSCKRVGTHCQFSRIPMKRGPSKGYIKELADRLNRLEGDMHNQAAGEIHYPPPPNADMGMSRRASQDFPPSPQMDGQQSGRKRTHSSISQEFGTPGYGQQRQSGQWSQFETPRHPAAQPFAQGPADPYRQIPSYSPNGLAPQPQFPNARDARAFADNNNIMDQQEAPKVELDEDLYDRYVDFINPTFPILPYKENLAQRLRQCAPIVATALNAALYSVISTLTGNHNPEENRKASNCIAQCMAEDFAQARLFDGGRIILLAAVTLMAIEAGHRSNSVGSQASYLGQAIAISQDLRLHSYQEGTYPQQDTDENLGRRLWWTLVIIDRFHATGKAVNLMIPETSVVLYKDDQQNLGQTTYELARISLALAHLANYISAPAPANANHPLAPSGRLVAGPINGILEEVRITLPNEHSSTTTPLTYLAFWHTRILLRRLKDDADPADPPATFNDAHDILSLVPATLSPLTKDFSVLAAVSLMELLDSENAKVKADAEQELKMYISGAPRFATPESWEVTLRDLILKRVTNIGSPNQGQSQPAQQHGSTSSAALTASQGLQHLADLATAGDTARQEPEAQGNGQTNGWDKGKLTKNGFLTVLGPRSPAPAPRQPFM